MSTYSDILAGIRANAANTEKGDGKTILRKFLDGTIGKPDKPTGQTDQTEEQPTTDAPGNAEIPPADAPEGAEGTDGAVDGEPSAEGGECAESDAPANTASAGALPEPDDDETTPPPETTETPPPAEKPRASRSRRGK